MLRIDILPVITDRRKNENCKLFNAFVRQRGKVLNAALFLLKVSDAPRSERHMWFALVKALFGQCRLNGGPPDVRFASFSELLS